MAAQLEPLPGHIDGLRIRKINIMGWSSAVAKQHSIRSLPHLVLYKGHDEIESGARAVAKELNDILH